MSPRCPIHFPEAVYLGEIVPGFYLGRLAQDEAHDAHGATLTAVTGRYGLFREDGGCGELTGLFPGIPSPSPATPDVEAQLDEMYAELDSGARVELPAEAAVLDDAHTAWLRTARRSRFLLTVTDYLPFLD